MQYRYHIATCSAQLHDNNVCNASLHLCGVLSCHRHSLLVFQQQLLMFIPPLLCCPCGCLVMPCLLPFYAALQQHIRGINRFWSLTMIAAYPHAKVRLPAVSGPSGGLVLPFLKFVVATQEETSRLMESCLKEFPLIYPAVAPFP